MWSLSSGKYMDVYLEFGSDMFELVDLDLSSVHTKGTSRLG